MLCSSSCENDNFSAWLAKHARIGEESEVPTVDTFWELLKPGKFTKPVLVFFDEIQALYNVNYAVSFWETIKRIFEEPKNWNVKVSPKL